MTNPVLVELTRGPLVESIHRGSFAIADADGRLVASIGDVKSPVYSRSSLKPIQALPLVESGAAEAFGLSDEEVALACASHSAEPMHTDRVAKWLERIGCTVDDLACGAHPIRDEAIAADMVRKGLKPTRLHNNCSGKHTGFLTVARHWDIATAGYEKHDHPVQKAVAAALADLTGMNDDFPWGIDGCAAPNFAVPLDAFAMAMARMASPDKLPPQRATAAKRIVRAMTKYPELVAGTGRACTILMRAMDGVAVKTGAEGFFIAIIPSRGLGVALKIDDGAGRASECVMAAILERLGPLGNSEAAHAYARGPLRNTRGEIVGEMRSAGALESIKWSALA
ncbi:MAG: asparaginase [Alphaproteobacteria bacterium]|nr:asparaginase [Alphaproteobacteria bacterium]